MRARHSRPHDISLRESGPGQTFLPLHLHHASCLACTQVQSVVSLLCLTRAGHTRSLHSTT